MATKHYVRKEYTNLASLPATGEGNVLYEVSDTGKLYRWNSISTEYVDYETTPPTLSEVLTVGNTTLNGQSINAASGTGQLDLRNGADGIVKLTGTEITLDGAVRVANTITSNAIGSTVKLNFADPFGLTVNAFSMVTDGGLYGAGSSWIFCAENGTSQFGYTYETDKAMGFGVFDSTWGSVGEDNADTITVHNNVSASANSGNSDKVASFVGTRNSIINAGVVNTVVLGGSGITASASDTVYVPNLNIGTVGTASSVYNLGIDSAGNIVEGSEMVEQKLVVRGFNDDLPATYSTKRNTIIDSDGDPTTVTITRVGNDDVYSLSGITMTRNDYYVRVSREEENTGFDDYDGYSFSGGDITIKWKGNNALYFYVEIIKA